MPHSFGLSFKNTINPASGFPLLDQKHQSHRSQHADALWNNAFPSHPLWYQTNCSLFPQHWQSQHKPQIRFSQSSVVWPPLGQNHTEHRSTASFHGNMVSEDTVIFLLRACQLHRQEMCQSRGLMAKWREQKDGVWRGSEGMKDCDENIPIERWGRVGHRKTRRNKKTDGEAVKIPSWERRDRRKRQYKGNWKAWALLWEVAVLCISLAGFTPISSWEKNSEGICLTHRKQKYLTETQKPTSTTSRALVPPFNSSCWCLLFLQTFL